MTTQMMKVLLNLVDDKVSANLRMNALKLNVRADGRDTKTVREINIETSILPDPWICAFY